MEGGFLRLILMIALIVVGFVILVWVVELLWSLLTWFSINLLALADMTMSGVAPNYLPIAVWAVWGFVIGALCHFAVIEARRLNRPLVGSLVIVVVFGALSLSLSQSLHDPNLAKRTATPPAQSARALTPEPAPVPTSQPTSTPEPTPAPTVTPVLTTPTPVPTIRTPIPLTETERFDQALRLAQADLRRGNWVDALSLYVNLAEHYPGREEPREQLASLLTEARNYPRRINEDNFSTVRPLLERAARLGVVPSMLLLGQSLRSRAPDDALPWFEKAAQNGSPEGMVQAGLLYGDRRDPVDDRKALEYFVRAADAGDKDGKYYAGECFYFPKPGLVQDKTKALEYLHGAAALGQLRAMDVLGTHYRNAGQYDQALRFYEEAARGGFASAIANLGVLYINGEGVAKSPERAVELFRQAAEQGDAGGMFSYGKCFFTGVVVQKDVRVASEWFRKAARAGSPAAIDFCRRHNLDFR